MPNHSRAPNRVEASTRITRLNPMRTAVTIADMPTEEVDEATLPKISHAIVSIPSEDGRISDDSLVPINATLEIAQNAIPSRYVVAEMAESLHYLSPIGGSVIPSRVAVELLVVLDKRLY